MTSPSTDKYLVDTCSYMDLDAIHPRPLFTCTASERTKIWTGLHSLAAHDRLFLITHVLQELKRHYPKPFPTNFKDIPVIRTGINVTDLAIDVSQILKKHPSLMKPSVRHTRDPADPWIVAVANKLGLIVVSSEKPRKANGRYKIPDTCQNNGIPCISFEEFIKREKIL